MKSSVRSEREASKQDTRTHSAFSVAGLAAGLDTANEGFVFEVAPLHQDLEALRYVLRARHCRRRGIGAILIGETNDSGLYYHWIRSQSIFPGKEVLSGTNTYASFQKRMA